MTKSINQYYYQNDSDRTKHWRRACCLAKKESIQIMDMKLFASFLSRTYNTSDSVVVDPVVSSARLEAKKLREEKRQEFINQQWIKLEKINAYDGSRERRFIQRAALIQSNNLEFSQMSINQILNHKDFWKYSSKGILITNPMISLRGRDSQK